MTPWRGTQLTLGPLSLQPVRATGEPDGPEGKRNDLVGGLEEREAFLRRGASSHVAAVALIAVQADRPKQGQTPRAGFPGRRMALVSDVQCYNLDPVGDAA